MRILLASHAFQVHDLVIGPDNAEYFTDKNHRYHNNVIGRYTNRIPTGKHELERNGVKSTFIALENGTFRTMLSFNVAY